MSGMEGETSNFVMVRFFGIMYLAFAIMLPLISFMIPSPDDPTVVGPSPLSLVMMVLMPIELLLVYAFYRVLGKRTTPQNITGIAILMFMTGIIPSVYAFLIGFTDPVLRIPGVLMGLSFGLAGVFLGWVLANRIWESIRLESA